MKGIPAILTADILRFLRASGHQTRIVIADAGKIGSLTCFSSFNQACAASKDGALCGSAKLSNPLPPSNIFGSEIITSGACD